MNRVIDHTGVIDFEAECKYFRMKSSQLEELNMRANKRIQQLEKIIINIMIKENEATK